MNTHAGQHRLLCGYLLIFSVHFTASLNYAPQRNNFDILMKSEDKIIIEG